MRRGRSLKKYKVRLISLIKKPFFWILTSIGNTIILLGALLLYLFESNQPSIKLSFLDCLIWSTGTVTTIGYGFMPLTTAGKITLLGLMLLGTVFVWSYMAFFVTGLIAPELSILEKDVHDVEKEIHSLRDLKT